VVAKRDLSQEIPVLSQTLELDPGAPLVLPEVFKAALGLEEGGTCTVVQLDSMVLLIARPLVSPEALDGMCQALSTAGVTLEDLLTSLADVRTQMLYERYGLTASA
jgi:hypothetical protein